jgi:thiol-disulfide isomerase/thioredoxin
MSSTPPSPPEPAADLPAMDPRLVEAARAPAAPPARRSWARVAGEWALTALLAAGALQVGGMLRAPELPAQAPDFALTSAAGDPLSLAQHRGQTVVLNFWAEWCGPCRMEIPSFAAFAENNPDIVILGLATDGDPRRLGPVAEKLGITWPVARADAETVAAYGVRSLPTTVVVGPDGEVKAAHAGMLFRPQLWWLTR